MGELDELRDKDYADQRKRPGIKSIEEKQIATEFQVNNDSKFLNASSPFLTLWREIQILQNMGLSDLDVLATLGVGGFGRVELVRASTTGEKRTFALKCLKKQVRVSIRHSTTLSDSRILLTHGQ